MGEVQLHTDMTKDDFLKLFKKCKDFRMRERYQAMYLSFKYGWKEISEILGRDYETVLSWVHAFNEDGLKGLERGKPIGRPASLSGEELDEVKNAVKASPRSVGLKFSNWSCKRIAAWIKKQFKKSLSTERVRQILHELGFTLVKPSYRFVLADKVARKRFLRQIKRVSRSFEEGDILLFQDEVSVKQHPTLTAKWVLNGTKEFVDTLGNHAKVTVFGAIDHALGKAYHMKSRKMNSDAFIKFAKRLITIHKDKRLFLVLDNAPWHKSLKVKEFLKDNKKKLRALWLPPYSPDFNPIEHLWKFMRETVSHNSFFPNIRELVDTLSEFFKGLYHIPDKIRSLCSPDYLFG
jgi:transposase